MRDPSPKLRPDRPAASRLRALLAEASEHRRRGDHGAAHVLDVAALIALRAIQSAAREVRQ